MADCFNISLAGLTVQMNAKYSYSKDFCKDYITNSDSIDIIATATDQEIAANMSEVDVSEGYAESLGLYRSIAEQLPDFSRFVMHGASITYNGNGIIFIAPSGTGKSTHIKLWRKAFGRSVDIVNGDKPVVDLSGDTPLIWGTPFAGKENWQKNTSAPLNAIVLLRRGAVDKIVKAQPSQYLSEIMTQIYRPLKEGGFAKTFTAANNCLQVCLFMF
ncbi:MAG: hypothetical protein KBS41_01470 [Oscillospiraceae bacterium]|nr:hypothetical protein [Candidatus Equicaccousia limihippi]